VQGRDGKFCGTTYLNGPPGLDGNPRIVIARVEQWGLRVRAEAA
jgi:hypothetical protein